MTMLDDYQPPYKLKGVQVVQAILQNVPSSLLRRTGIDTLLRTVRVPLEHLAAFLLRSRDYVVSGHLFHESS